MFRNIPAYAGKTILTHCGHVMAEEHPRVCGENDRGLLDTIKGGGTSPRMRGKPLVKAEQFAGFRNIPAYAGKTSANFANVTHSQEHPRVCGENPVAAAGSLTSFGTSPRMRGKLSPLSKVTSAVQEHPRVCGENKKHCPETPKELGTSPRMRGKPES